MTPELQLINKDSLAIDLESMFAEAPTINDLHQVNFNQALDRVIADKSDEQAFSMITSSLEAVRVSGDIGRLYSMAMELGAMACLHDHLQGFASEAGESLDLFGDKKHDHSEGESHKEDKHNSSTCANCKSGKPCPKKR